MIPAAAFALYALQTPPAAAASQETAAPPIVTVAAPAGSSTGSAVFTLRAQSWCDIWIDGKQVAKKTTAMEFRIPAGEHDVEFARGVAEVPP